MIKVDNIEVFNFEGAIRGLRNPMNSWSKSDSHHCNWEISESCDKCGKLDADNTGMCESYKEFYCIGENDLDLMRRLFKAGTEHRKYLRQIFVSMDITAPLYWWKEEDQYKVGTVTNSCSTMHKLMAKEFEFDDFSTDRLVDEPDGWIKEANRTRVLSARTAFEDYLHVLNAYRYRYIKSPNTSDWYSVVQMLPSSYNQKRTVTMNYENVFTIIRQRTSHKLDEWNKFVEILKTLPYVKEIGGLDEESS